MVTLSLGCPRITVIILGVMAKQNFIFYIILFLVVRRSVHYDTEDARIRVTSDGDLVSSNLNLNSSQFCLANQWEGDVSNAIDLNSEYIVVGLSCEPCKSKVEPSSVCISNSNSY